MKCSSCGKPCKKVRVDEGMGRVEHFGNISFHHEWLWLSDCCNESLLDGEGNEVDTSSFTADEEASRGDYLYEMMKDRKLMEGI